MKKFLLLFLFITVVVQNAKSQSKLDATQVFEKCNKSVVTIYIFKDDNYVASASGVYLGNKMLSTNYHVLIGFIENGADLIFIKNGDTLKCQIASKTKPRFQSSSFLTISGDIFPFRISIK